MTCRVLLNAIRNVVAIDRVKYDHLSGGLKGGETIHLSGGLKAGETIHFSDIHSDPRVRLAGFSAPEPDGRWTESAVATIDLKLAPESLGIGGLRLHLVPFVTETRGQTLHLRYGKGEERVVEFLPAARAPAVIELPFKGIRPDERMQIQLAVDHTFKPVKLGLGPDPRPLGVKVHWIEILSAGESVGSQEGHSIADSYLVTTPLTPLRIGSTVNLASPEAEQTVRLAGFSPSEADGRWTDTTAATVAIRLAKHPCKARLRLHLTPFVTPNMGQSISLRLGEGPELVHSYSPGDLCETTLDLPLNEVPRDREVLLSLKIDTPNSPAALGLGEDPRQLGIKLRGLELVNANRIRNFAARLRRNIRRVPQSLLKPMRSGLFKLRDFLIAQIGETLGTIERQAREHRSDLAVLTRDLTDLARLATEGFTKQETQLDALRRAIEPLATLAEVELLGACLVTEGFTKQETRLDALRRAIEPLATRAEVELLGARLAMLDRASGKIEQLYAALRDKTDILLNRFVLPVDDDTILVRSPVGYLYCSRNDHSVLTCLADTGEFEPGLRRVLERVLRPGATFVDVGAHLGLHTLAAARSVGDAGHVFSLEPTPTTCELLRRTVRLYELDDRVTVWQAAAGREDTQMPLHIGAISSHSSLYPLPGAKASVQVKVVQLSKLLPPGQPIDVVKLDVEGAELDVLQGMSRLVEENPDILIIAEYGPSHLIRSGVTPADWLSAFTRGGFSGYVIEEPLGTCVPMERVDLSGVFSVNIAFVRPSSKILARLMAAAPALPSVVVIGAGGHAKVVVELIRAQGAYNVIGCTDRVPNAGAVVGAPVLGSDDILPELYARGATHCFIALGDNVLRQKAAMLAMSLGFELVNAISPNAVISPTATLGRGVAVMAGAVINAAATIKDLAIVNTHAVVDHDCQIGEAAHVAPRATLAGSVRVGPLAFIGAGATIVPGVSIGEATVIGAGATVTSDFGPNLVAAGVPAKPLKRRDCEQREDHGE